MSSDATICHGVNGRSVACGEASNSARIASRSAFVMVSASARASSGEMPCRWRSTSSMSAFCLRIIAILELPTTSRTRRRPGPASTGCCCCVSPQKTILAPVFSDSCMRWWISRVESMPASSAMMILRWSTSSWSRAAILRSFATENIGASTSVPRAVAVRQGTAVAMMFLPASRHRSARGRSVVVLPLPAAPSMTAMRPSEVAAARMASICSSLTG